MTAYRWLVVRYRSMGLVDVLRVCSDPIQADGFAAEVVAGINRASGTKPSCIAIVQVLKEWALNPDTDLLAESPVMFKPA